MFSCITYRNLSHETSRDGSKPTKAILVHVTNEFLRSETEQKWLQNKYPGYFFKSKAMVTDNGSYYDRITIQTINGQEQTVYFDITQIFQVPLLDLQHLFNDQQK